MAGRRSRAFTQQPEPTDAREALERCWFRRRRPMPEIAELVTGEQLEREPRHRWLAYRQAFAPKLVRLFLRHAEDLQPDDDCPVLDPFSGSGVTTVECAVRGAPAVGIDAIPALAYLAAIKGHTEFPDLPDPRGTATWADVAEIMTEPIHRAALMLAVARRHGSDGKPLKAPLALRDALNAVASQMRADVLSPILRPVDVRCGDARRLDEFSDAGISGILTSPPYLSRHDYTRITRPLQLVYQHWFPLDGDNLAKSQLRAHPRAARAGGGRGATPAVEECCQALDLREQPRTAVIVRAYFDDIAAAVDELARVARPGAPAWIVIGAARLESVYIPSDIILADLAEQAGFEVLAIRVARHLTRSGRKLGRLEDVAPRESLVIMRRT